MNLLTLRNIKLTLVQYLLTAKIILYVTTILLTLRENVPIFYLYENCQTQYFTYKLPSYKSPTHFLPHGKRHVINHDLSFH